MIELTPAKGLRAVLIGILIGMTVGIFGWSWVTFCVIFSCLFFYVKNVRTDKTRVIEILILILGIGGGLAISTIPTVSNTSVAHLSGYHILDATIVRTDQTLEQQKLTVTDIEIRGEQYEDRMLLFVPPYRDWQYGDRIRFSCTLQQPEPFDGFAYDQFLASRDIYQLCFLRESPQLRSQGHGNALLYGVAGVRTYFIDSARSIFGEPHGTLLSGLLFGQELFTDAWSEKLQATGTTHIVAASGYNVALVTWLLFGLLTWLGMRRQKAFWILLTGIVLFVLLAGAEAAVLRAGIMGALILVAKTIGRRASLVNVLLLTAVGMLLLNPLILRYDVGFQLSMLSTIGLIYLTPWISAKLTFIPEDYTLRESLSATLAATAATLPILLIQFGQIAFISPIANLLILPLLPYTMFFGAVALVVGTFSSTAAMMVSAPAWLLLEIILLFIRFLSELSWVYVF